MKFASGNLDYSVVHAADRQASWQVKGATKTEPDYALRKIARLACRVMGHTVGHVRLKMTERDWSDVHRCVEQRLVVLKMNWADLARASAISVRKIQDMRNNVPLARSKTRSLVTEALGWTPDSIDRILAGGEPELSTPPTDASELAELRQLLVDLASEVRRLQSEVRRLASEARSPDDVRA